MKTILSGFRRTYVNGYRPFIVEIDGKDIFLFRASERTYLSVVIKIEKKFKDDEIAFFTEDAEFSDKVFSIDVTNAYEAGGGQRKLYLLNENKFYETEIIVENKSGTRKVVLSDRVAQIKGKQNDNDKDKDI